jgi:hypothetical protein
MEAVSYSTGSNLLEVTFIKTSSPTIASWNESFCERNADKQSSCPVKAANSR